MRPTRNENLMQIAQIVAERGTCDRKQVGAVIAREGRIISVGYNGAPPGLPHCDENGHGHLNEAFARYPDGPNDKSQAWLAAKLAADGCRNATHAEANALAFAAKYGVSTERASLFVTVSPCENCARLLIAAGIEIVYYREAYRERAGLELLGQAHIGLCYAG